MNQASPALAQHCIFPEEVELQQNDIFDTSKADTIWLHHLANKLHFITKPAPILEELSGFKVCPDDPANLAEIERHLRNSRYLRDARVNKTEQGKVRVETWDTWSLLPTINIGRSGGENNYSLGLKDTNFLGYGIYTKLAYKKNYLRTGYSVAVRSPLFTGNNAYAGIHFADNSDGQQKLVNLYRPFMSLASDWGASASFNDLQMRGLIKAGHEDAVDFSHSINQGEVWYGWRLNSFSSKTKARRIKLGYTIDDQEFSQSVVGDEPADRQFKYPWIEIEKKQDGYQKLTNVYLINRIEDINFNLDYRARIGFDISNSHTSGKGALWQFGFQKATAFSDRFIWKTSFSKDGERRANGKYRIAGRFYNELFYRISQPFSLYTKLDTVASQNQYIDRPVTLGGENGLRGYPIQYRHGDHYALATLEGRWYPNFNVYRLFELAGVAFVDVGNTFGTNRYGNDDSLMSSVGIGLRAYSTHAANNNVVHVDIAKPLSNDPKLSNWELRVQVKEQF